MSALLFLDASPFGVDLPDNVLDHLRSEIDQQAMNSIAKAESDLASRFYLAVSKLADRQHAVSNLRLATPTTKR